MECGFWENGQKMREKGGGRFGRKREGWKEGCREGRIENGWKGGRDGGREGRD